MRSGVEPAGVSLKGTVGATRLRRTGSHMVYSSQECTSVNVSEEVNELTDGMVRSLNATTGAEMSPYRKSPSRRLSRSGSCRQTCYHARDASGPR
jgi:hypothetical protein